MELKSKREEVTKRERTKIEKNRSKTLVKGKRKQKINRCKKKTKEEGGLSAKRRRGGRKRQNVFLPAVANKTIAKHYKKKCNQKEKHTQKNK